MWIFFVDIVFSLFFLFSLGYVELGLEVGESALSLFFSARGRPVAGLLSLYPQSPNHPTQQIRASPCVLPYPQNLQPVKESLKRS